MKKITEYNSISIEDLKMTREEFRFIRRKLKISQKNIDFLGTIMSGSTISMMEQEEFINPALVYQLLSGEYAPTSVVEALRNEFREKFSKGN